MRILVATPSYVPTPGGLERVLDLLVRQWRSIGHQVVVWVPKDGIISKDEWLVAEGSLRQAAKASDVIIVANSAIRMWPSLIGFEAKTFLQHHSTYEHVDLRGWWHSRVTKMVRSAWIRTAKNIAVSPAVRDALEPFGGRWHTLWNPVEVDEGSAGRPWPQRDYDFVFVGRLVSDKGLDVLLSALPYVDRDCKALIIGDGPDRHLSSGNEWTSHGRSRVRWIGSAAPAEVLGHMANARWLVVPSRYEPFGIVAVEGVGMGCGLIVSRTGGLAPHEGSVAFGFDPEDTAELARILTHSLDLRERPVEWAQGASRLVDRHNPTSVASKYVELLSTRAARSKGR